MSDGAVTDPQFNRTEHVDSNVSAKRVVPYFWDGGNLVQEGTEQSERYDYSSSTAIYVGHAPQGSSAASAVWTITKYDLSDSSAASGLIATAAVWNNRASGTYT